MYRIGIQVLRANDFSLNFSSKSMSLWRSMQESVYQVARSSFEHFFNFYERKQLVTKGNLFKKSVELMGLEYFAPL